MPRFKDDLTTLDACDGIAEAKRRILKRLAAMRVLEKLSDWARRSESDPFAARKVIHLGA